MRHIDTKVIEQVIRRASERPVSCDDLRRALSLLDHTSLSNSDSPETITGFVAVVNELQDKKLPMPATVCVYPALVESVGIELGDSPVGITAVCGGFPSGLTYLEVKILECAMAIENGADEIDIVINTGALLSGDYDVAEAEIEAIVAEIDGDATLKVILETGTLQTEQLIFRASMLAMNAGADFIKTSTGKSGTGATPEAVALMCMAISDHHTSTDRLCGLKVSGGVDTAGDAVRYMNIAREILGEEFVTSAHMRIGSSKALRDIVRRIENF